MTTAPYNQHFLSSAFGEAEGDIQSLTALLTANPSDADSYQKRAELYYQCGHYREALEDMNEALVLCDGYHHYFHYQGSLYYQWRGDLYVLENDKENALKDYDKALFFDHNNRAAMNAKDALMNDKAMPSRDYRAAFECDLDYALRIKQWPQEQLLPSSAAAALYAKAGVLGRDGHYRDAIDMLGQAIQLFSESASLYHDRGFFYQQLEEMDLAQADYESALKRSPTHSHAWYGKGRCAMARGEYKSAMECFNHAITLSSEQHDAYHQFASVGHMRRGKLSFFLGNRELAINDYTKALDLYPKNVDALLARANCYKGKGNIANAIADYTAVIAINPQHEQALHALMVVKNV